MFAIDLKLKGLVQVPARASMARKRERMRSELGPDECRHVRLKEPVSLQNLKSRPMPAGCEML